MRPAPHRGFFLWILALLGLGLAAAVADGAPDWYRLSPDEFARLPAAQRRIDPAAFDEDLLAAAIFQESNRVRLRLGLKPFTHVQRLNVAAGLKASIGVLEPEVRHQSDLPFSATPADRVRQAGLDYSRVAENIARLPSYDLPPGDTKLGMRDRHGRTEFYRLDTGAVVELQTYAGFAAAAVTAWMNSPGHRANLVNPELRSLGCAARPCVSLINRHEQIYAVQVFYTPP